MIKNIFFFCSTFLILSFLCAFHCWLGWRTFSWNGDTASMVLLNMSGWHPAIVSWMLKGIYYFTDIHIYPFLLLQIIPFYLSVFIIVWAVYCRWHTVWAFFLIFIFYTKQNYMMTVDLMSTSFSAIWVLLLYSLVIYSVLNPLKKWVTRIIFYTFTAAVFFVAINTRQNAIIQVWPVTLIWIGQYLNKKDFKIKSYLKRFISYGFLSGVACLLLMFASDAVMTHSDNGHVYPATSTFVHQIVGACIPEMDKTCFDESWWTDKWNEKEHKWAELQERYEKYPVLADVFVSVWIPHTPFRTYTDLKDLYKKWFYAITRHPYNATVHILGFYKTMWFSSWKRYSLFDIKVVPATEFEAASYHTHPVSKAEKKARHKLARRLRPEEYRTIWDKKRKIFGMFLEKHLPYMCTFYVVMANFILFFIGLGFWFKRRQDKVVWLFTMLAFGGVLSNIFIPLFTPATWMRYLHPIFICATASLCVFIPFLISFIIGLDYWNNLKDRLKLLLKRENS